MKIDSRLDFWKNDYESSVEQVKGLFGDFETPNLCVYDLKKDVEILERNAYEAYLEVMGERDFPRGLDFFKRFMTVAGDMAHMLAEHHERMACYNRFGNEILISDEFVVTADFLYDLPIDYLFLHELTHAVVFQKARNFGLPFRFFIPDRLTKMLEADFDIERSFSFTMIDEGLAELVSGSVFLPDEIDDIFFGNNHIAKLRQNGYRLVDESLLAQIGAWYIYHMDQRLKDDIKDFGERLLYIVEKAPRTLDGFMI